MCLVFKILGSYCNTLKLVPIPLKFDIMEEEGIYHDEVEIEDFDYDPDTETFSYPCPCGDLFTISKVCTTYDITE